MHCREQTVSEAALIAIVERSDRPMTIRRLKTYTGSQGYVYQYYFVGKRLCAGVCGQ